MGKIICSAAFLIILISCGKIKEPEYRGIDSFKVLKVRGDTSTLSVNVRYYNPNNKSLKLKNANGNAYIDSIYVGQFFMDTMINISKLSDFTVPVILRANMKSVYRNAVNVFLNNEFNLRLEGQCRIGKGGIFFQYPIRYQGKQALNLF